MGELVKMLRVCGDSNNSCGNCPARENDGSCPHGEWEFAAEKYMLDAADAIEELLSERDEVNADSWKTAFEVERDEHQSTVSATEGGVSMSVYIKGMEMPKDCDALLHIRPDGRAVLYPFNGTDEPHEFTAVPVPPHGRLIDADALLKKCEFVCDDDDVDVRAVRYSVIDDAPTIIEAEEGE